MALALTLRAALLRGATSALANWPVVVVDFLAESLYKLTLVVPVVGGALMVWGVIGLDLRATLGEGLFVAAQDLLLLLLANAPVALVAFLAALAIVGIGGAVMMFIVKGGTLGVLALAETRGGEFHMRPIGSGVLAAARAYSFEALWQATRRYQQRMAKLGAALGVIYTAVGTGYLLSVAYGFQWIAESAWAPALGVLMFLATSAAVVVVTAAHLIFDLARVAIVIDDCGVRVAIGRVWRFLLADARQVIGIFGVMLALVLAATAASLAATAGLTLLSWVPLLGLLFLPLQIAFWIARNLLFQYMNLTTLSAYLTQYHRFAAPAAASFPRRVNA